MDQAIILFHIYLYFVHLLLVVSCCLFAVSCFLFFFFSNLRSLLCLLCFNVLHPRRLGQVHLRDDCWMMDSFPLRITQWMRCLLRTGGWERLAMQNVNGVIAAFCSNHNNAKKIKINIYSLRLSSLFRQEQKRKIRRTANTTDYCISCHLSHS